MKNYAILLFTLFVFSFLSCEEEMNTDDNENTASALNYITYDGKEYEISQGQMYMDEYSEENSFYWLKVWITSDNLDWANASGNGNLILFDYIYSSSGTEISPGTYDCEDHHYDLEAFCWGDVSFGLNLNFTTDEADYDLILSDDGIIKVEKSGDQYDIKITGTTGEGKEIKAHYKGTIEKFN